MGVEKILREGMFNWKLRLILSALLCLIGLSFLISMVLGVYFSLNIADQTLTGVAIFIVGTPVYLILSKLGEVDEYTIAGFLNATVAEMEGEAGLLLKEDSSLNKEDTLRKQKLEEYLRTKPLRELLPDRPVRQAYYLMLFSMLSCLAIWFLNNS